MPRLPAASMCCCQSFTWRCVAHLQAASLLPAAEAAADSSTLQVIQLLIGQRRGKGECERTSEDPVCAFLSFTALSTGPGQSRALINC